MFPRGQINPLTPSVERLIAQRKQARREKRFPLVDDISGQLQALGVSFEDRMEGTVWWFKR